MSIIIRNLQMRVKFCAATLERDAGILKGLLQVSSFDLGIGCLGKEMIKGYNRKFRRRNKSTDVLAFPNFVNLKPGQIPVPDFPWDKTLGDILLGMSDIYDDCQRDEHDLQQYLSVIMAHGLCHLMGYRHDTDQQLKQMYQKELELLTELNRLTGYNVYPVTATSVEGYKHTIPDRRKPKYKILKKKKGDFDGDNS